MLTLPEKSNFHVTTVVHTTIKTKRIHSRSGSGQHSLVFRIEGSAELFANGKTFLSERGHVTLVPQSTPYIAHYNVNEMIFVHFSADTPPSNEPLNFKLRNPETVKTLFYKLAAVWSTKRIGFQLEADALLAQIFVAILRDEQEENQTYLAACAIMNNEFSDPDLSVESIAARVHTSPSQLRRIFNAQFGAPPIRYLNELRVDRAAALLSSQKIAVAEVALQCGFSDTQYFSRVVKKLRNCSPSQLRFL